MNNITLYRYLHSELNNAGHSEFIKGNLFDDNNYMKKILSYDDDVKDILNRKIFHNLKLNEEENDDRFKKHFVLRFTNYQIAGQTIEQFSSQVCYTMYNNIDFLNEYMENQTDYLRMKSDSKNTGNEKSITDNRSANATLPQTEINIDVDNTILKYADDNSINRQKGQSEREQKDNSFRYDIDNLMKSKSIYEEVLQEFERNCFLKVW